jgi:hypothetical protein
MSTDPTDPTDPKPHKALPTAAEITAYVERSAARTKLRLPLAKGAVVLERAPAVDAATVPSPVTAPKGTPLARATSVLGAATTTRGAASTTATEGALHSGKNASRALPVHGAKGVENLRTEPVSGATTRLPKAAARAPAEGATGALDDTEAWRPFSADDEP